MRHELQRPDGSYEIQETTGHAVVRYGVPALVAIAVGAMCFWGGATSSAVGGAHRRGGHKPGQSYATPGTPTLTVAPGDTFANLYTSAFSGSPGDSHASTSWWITRESTPTDTVWSALATADSLEQYSGAGATYPLIKDSVYIAHVFHTATFGGNSATSVDTFTATATVFSETFESYNDGDNPYTVNPSIWGNGHGQLSPNVRVTDTLAHSGTKSLLFRFNGKAPGLDCTAEANFSLTSSVDAQTGIWVEYYIRYPAGYYHRIESSGGNNNKFLRIWGTDGVGDDYNDGSKFGFSTLPVSSPELGDSELEPEYHKGALAIGNFSATKVNPAVYDSTRAKWVLFRAHAQMSSDSAAADGFLRVQFDTAYVANDSLDMYGPTAGGFLHWDEGYLLGYANTCFTDTTYIAIDDIKMYASDPGWGW